MFVTLGFVPMLPEFLCQFCVLSALMPVSTNSLKVTNNEDSLLKKLTNPQANKKKKNQPKNLYCCRGTAPLADSVGSTPGGGSSSVAGIHHYVSVVHCLTCPAAYLVNSFGAGTTQGLCPYWWLHSAGINIINCKWEVTSGVTVESYYHGMIPDLK